MFSPGNDIDDIYEHSANNKCKPQDSALLLNSAVLRKADIWDKILNIEEVKTSSINLCVSENNDLLTELTKSICGAIQFPHSTAFLHGLGCVASACAKSFRFNYNNKEKPLNMYVVTAQPPSTGKSGVNDIFTYPIAKAYGELNAENKKQIISLEKQLAILSKEVDDADLIAGNLSPTDQAKLDEMWRVEEELNKTCTYKHTLTDATIEAAEVMCSKQTGMFNVISAEADSINNLLGLTYGDSKSKKVNHGLVLQGWDGEWFSSARVTRDSYEGFVRGSIAVIAQDSSIDSLLSVASGGRGTTERFLLLREESLLGKRNHLKKTKMSKSLIDRYNVLIENIINESDAVINVPDSSTEIIDMYRQGIEHEMLNGGRYDNNLMTGFIGKADKHILKIACTLFVIDKWQSLATRDYNLTDNYVYWAVAIFSELAKLFENSADDLGYAGGGPENQKMIDILSKYASNGKFKVSINQFRSNHHKTKPFDLIRGFKSKLINSLLPKMAELNYCVFDESFIYINPRLK